MSTNTLEPDVAIPTDEAERDELFPGEVEEPVNTMDITRKVWALREIEKLIIQYDKQDAESRQFYADRKAVAQARIDFVKAAIQGFLRHNNLQRLATPNGTAYFRACKLKYWPNDEALLAWTEAHLPGAIRLRREPDKKAIGEHIKTTGEVPDGYTEREESRLYLR